MSTHTTDVLDRLNTEPTLSVDETKTALGVGRTAVYGGIQRGEIPVIRVGRRMRVPSTWVRAQLGMEAVAGT
ncbi:excisionase family DNA-binding protein [Nocardia asteroides]